MNVDKQTIQAHPVEDYIMGVIDSIRQIALDKEMKMGLTTGFNSIDEVTGGFQGGDLITIAGSASTGKTSFALSIARNIAMEQKIPTLFFSFEMSAEVVFAKITLNSNEPVETNSKLSEPLVGLRSGMYCSIFS